MSAWVLILITVTGGAPPVVMSGIESEAECHRVANLMKQSGHILRYTCLEYSAAGR